MKKQFPTGNIERYTRGADLLVVKSAAIVLWKLSLPYEMVEHILLAIEPSSCHRRPFVRVHTTTRLKIEYHCHSDLYAPTSQIFYEGTVKSHNDPAIYAPPLNKLMQSLPRSIFQSDDTVFRLSKYTHFLDVQGGKCVYAPGGSIQNELEVRVAISLVRGLLATVPGVKQKHLCAWGADINAPKIIGTFITHLN